MSEPSSGQPPRIERKHDDPINALQQEILRLLDQRIPLTTIAALLSAEEYLEFPRGKAGGVRLNVRRFIAEKAELLRDVQFPDHMRMSKGVGVPPGEGRIESGSGAGMDKETQPRTLLLMQLLGELGYNYDANMMEAPGPESVRDTPFWVFTIVDIGKVILVCNESHNTTFVVHDMQDDETGDDWALRTKDELYAENVPGGRVTPVQWTKDYERWKDRIAAALQLNLSTGPGRQPRVAVALVESDPNIPDDWKSVRDLAREREQNPFRFLAAAQELAPLHPDHIKLKPGTRSSYKLSSTGEQLIIAKVLQHNYPPPGAKNVLQIATAAGVTDGLVRSRVESLRASNPEAIGEYQHPTRHHVLSFVHAEEAERLIAELAAQSIQLLPEAPEGYVLAAEFIAANDIHESKFYRYIAILKPLHPTEFERMRSKKFSGIVGMHLSPNAQELVRRHHEIVTTWETPDALSRTLGVDPAAVPNWMRPLVETRPELVYTYNSGQRSFVYYHPSLTEQARQVVEAFKEKTKDSIPIPTAAELLNIDRTVVNRLADDIARTHPDLVIRRKISDKHTDTYLLPGFVQLVQDREQEVQQLGECPPNWRRVRTAYGNGSYDEQLYERALAQVRAERPEQFGMFRSRFATAELYGTGGVAKKVNTLLQSWAES